MMQCLGFRRKKQCVINTVVSVVAWKYCTKPGTFQLSMFLNTPTRGLEGHKGTGGTEPGCCWDSPL